MSVSDKRAQIAKKEQQLKLLYITITAATGGPPPFMQAKKKDLSLRSIHVCAAGETTRDPRYQGAKRCHHRAELITSETCSISQMLREEMP